MLALWELCEWLNITECHARKLVARNAIPYRKVGHLLRFPESEVEEWSRPRPRVAAEREPRTGGSSGKAEAAPCPHSASQVPYRRADRSGGRAWPTTVGVIFPRGSRLSCARRAPDGYPDYPGRDTGLPCPAVEPGTQRQIERTAEGLDAAKKLLEEFNEAKRRPGRLQAEHVRFADVAARYLVAFRVKRDGTARPKSSLAKERTCLNVYILPALGNAWIGDLDLPELNATVRYLTLQDGSPASGSTKSTVASVLRRLFAWAREERIIPVNPALELRTGWGGSVRRRVIIPSIPQVLRLAQALDLFKPGLGDVAMVLAFTGLRWEEAVAVPIDNVSLDG